jgi:hypothetical protein
VLGNGRIIGGRGCNRETRDQPHSVTEASMRGDSNERSRAHEAQFVAFDEMDPELAIRMEEMVSRVEDKPLPYASKLRRERNRSQPVRYGVSDQPLPGGAVAAVLREPEPAPMRLVVISPRADDRALFLGDIALDRDEDAVPEPEGSRLILIAEDGGVVMQARSGSDSAQLDVSIPDSCSRELISPFLHAAESSPPISVPGIGTVRIPVQ